jgi:hypothetical protein
MDVNVPKEVATLQRMTPSELREKYAEVYGEPTVSRNRTWLMRRIAWRIQVNAEGDLSERAKARAAELTNPARAERCARVFEKCFTWGGTGLKCVRECGEIPPSISLRPPRNSPARTGRSQAGDRGRLQHKRHGPGSDPGSFANRQFRRATHSTSNTSRVPGVRSGDHEQL